MEFAPPLTNLRTQLCVVIADLNTSVEREDAWPEAAEEFLRRMSKLGLHITIVGARPPLKFGSKKTIRFMDRHEVVGMKVLAASRSHRLEFRVLNRKSQAWTRLRAEACVTIGSNGVWPIGYEGWAMPGTLTVNALSRWVQEHKWVPGREFAFVGSTNQAMRWASILLDRGAKGCYIIEPTNELRCWRAHRDRFIAKGGRILLKHELKRVAQSGSNVELFLSNEQGTLIMPADTVVLLPINENALNAPEHWKNGLFYVQRRILPGEEAYDEEYWFERVDWREVYWRVARMFKLVDHAEAEGALRMLRNERRKMLEYRKPGARKDLGYSGKILDRDTIAAVQSSGAVPRSFARAKPVASLECFENIPCRACVDVCPEGAITLGQLLEQPVLIEDKCTGCGACVAICPAGAAVMVKELPVQQKARYFLPDNTAELWKPGRPLNLLNRKGEFLGVGRVVSSASYQDGTHRVLEIESTNVHVWEGRNYRIPKTDFASSDLEPSAQSPNLLKRGWVMINGVRRLCPVDVPITVALWQLGQRRFEDARFCQDGSCQMCEVSLNGKPVLACQTLIYEGQSVTFEKKAPCSPQTLCPCKNVTRSEYSDLVADGVPEKIAREITGVGHGACHGRWCFGSPELASGKDNLRPRFHGYEASPWRDIWPEDITDIDDPDDA